MRKGSSLFWLVRALASAPPVVVAHIMPTRWGSAGGALVRHLHALVHVLAVQVPQQLGVRCGAACVVGVGPCVWSVRSGVGLGAACTPDAGCDVSRREARRTAMIAFYYVCGLRLSRVVTAHGTRA